METKAQAQELLDQIKDWPHSDQKHQLILHLNNAIAAFTFAECYNLPSRIEQQLAYLSLKQINKLIEAFLTTEDLRVPHSLYQAQEKKLQEESQAYLNKLLEEV